MEVYLLLGFEPQLKGVPDVPQHCQVWQNPRGLGHFSSPRLLLTHINLELKRSLSVVTELVDKSNMRLQHHQMLRGQNDAFQIGRVKLCHLKLL